MAVPGPAWVRNAPRRAAMAAVACLALVATPALSGCGSPTATITTNSGYIPQPTTPGTTVAYMDIRNNGKTTDRLVSATTSVGGQVSFLAPDGLRSGTMVMKLVRNLTIPAQSLLRMNPNSYRLRITGAGSMQG
ncbi:MAG TPA: copper chaperone PCu(A)C, partial [Streptosporangiaceae bacterium]|nr:copper chaperone PCu(A)C [Streptosporangiaceae bacterium]